MQRLVTLLSYPSAATQGSDTKAKVLKECAIHKVKIGNELVTDYYLYEDLLRVANSQELARLFRLVAERKLTQLPLT